MALGDNTSNDIPLGVGYDANGNAKSFVELSAISVTNVSATQYWGLPAGSDGTLSGLSDTCVSSTGARAPLHGESLVYSAGCWTPCAVIAGGGGGGGITSVNGDTGPDVGLYFSSLSGVTFTDLGGATDEGDGLLPQHVQWNGSEWINAFEDEQYLRIRNETGSQLTKGQAVYIAGVQGEIPLVDLADASDSSKMPCVGLVHETIDTNKTGLAVTFGTGQLSTNVEGTAAIGKTAYVSPTTAGGLTVDKPDGSTELIQNVGIVIRTNSETQRLKVTSVGRANDVPNTATFNGSVTVGNTVLSQTSAILSNVEQNSLMITNSTSAVSSLSGASGTIPYFEGTTPAPGLKTFAQILTNENYNISPGATYATTTSLATTTAYAEGVSAAVAAGYQPLDSDLTSIAGLTVAAGSIIYATAANTYAVLLRPSGSGVYTLKIDMDNARIPIWVLDPSP